MPTKKTTARKTHTVKNITPDQIEKSLKLYMEPTFREVDEGDGGIRRVVEAQRKHLHVTFVDRPEDADVIACHLAPLDSTLKYIIAHPDVPFVAHIHGGYWSEYDWPGWALRANEKVMQATRLGDAVTGPSEWVSQSLRRNTLRKVETIWHGVDLEEWPLREDAEPPQRPAGIEADPIWGDPLSDADNAYVLWNKTRTDPVCNPQDLVQLALKAPDVQFRTTFWPEGEPIPPNVTVTGKLSFEEGKREVQNAGVYLCTTRETFGIGTIEAMAASVPILGWKWAGQAEFVKQEETGWLARPGDFDGLLEGLRWCLRNRVEAGRAARADVETRFQWKDIIPQYDALYRRVLAAKDGPVVSVIVPAYNLDKYLPLALDSVLAQNYADWECLIVNDASPDNTPIIAQEYALKDPRFKIITNEKNQYLAGSLNIGVAASKGRYIFPLDADNMLASPNVLWTLVTELDNDRSTDIAYGKVQFVKEDGEPDTDVGPGGYSQWPQPFKPDWQIKGRNMIPSSSLYRRRVWELTGGYRRRWKTAEDADFWTRATSYGFGARMVTDADVLIYRNREGSMSRIHDVPEYIAWYPWGREGSPPGGALLEPQPPIPSCEPVLISVVIPVGPGHEELVIDALDSVDAQSFRLWEVIVVNDSGKPLRWLPSWARVFDTHKSGMGPAAARNIGLANARGRLFVPLDADDTLEPQALEQMFQTQKRWGGYVYGDWNEINDGKKSTWTTPEYDAALLIPKGLIHAVTGLYPVAAWKQVGGYDEDLPNWEDWDFVLKLADIGVCGTRYPKPIFTYRKDTGMRRDAAFGSFEESKAGILAKWKDYFNGNKELMGCRSCGGGGGGRVSIADSAGLVVGQGGAPPAEGTVLIEYTGKKEGAVSFRGPSGTTYRFAATSTDRIKMVRTQDVEFFERLPDFSVRAAEAV